MDVRVALDVNDMKKRGCLSCYWADFLKTPTGKLVKNETIRCRYPVSNFATEIEEFKRSLPSSMQHIEIRLYPHGMAADDGQDCPVWQAPDEEER
jgi:hypothetical protein